MDEDIPLIRKWQNITLDKPHVNELMYLCRAMVLLYRSRRKITSGSDQDVEKSFARSFTVVANSLRKANSLNSSDLAKIMLIDKVQEDVAIIPLSNNPTAIAQTLEQATAKPAGINICCFTNIAIHAQLSELYIAVAALQNNEVTEYIGFAQRYKGFELEQNIGNMSLIGTQYLEFQYLQRYLASYYPASKLIPIYEQLMYKTFDKFMGCIALQKELTAAECLSKIRGSAHYLHIKCQSR